MKYDVRFRNNIGYFNDTYTVEAEDPTQAREIAVMRLIEETGTGLEMWKIIDVEKRIDRPSYF
jgi:hypothetical protein